MQSKRYQTFKCILIQVNQYKKKRIDGMGSVSYPDKE